MKGDGPAPESEPQIEFDISQIFDASELDDLTLDTSQAVNRSSISAWLQEPSSEADLRQPDPLLAVPSEMPDLAELVNLIQELNQCNGMLMARVSQLEEALEHSQTALQDEVVRTQTGSDSDQDWSTVQEQVTNLFNQLEFAHQTNQRQQIVIETLTGQLENSQERVAELEREAASIQQRHNEQSQLLVKSEHTSRDLQSRLQRQQRYTLQFKAALEKSLEVPTPQYEVGLNLEPVAAEMPLTAALFLPKAKRIQPWSTQTHASKTQPLSKSPWMKFQNQAVSPAADGLAIPLDLPQSNLAQPNLAQPNLAQSNLAQSNLAQPSLRPPSLRPLTPETALETGPEATPEATPKTALAPSLPEFGSPLPQLLEQPSERLGAAADLDLVTPDPALKQQVDEAVKPLADLLAEALLGEAKALPSSSAATRSHAGVAPTTAPVIAPTDEKTADELLAAVMADAEDALWQDLARLIDVSAEDVVKASLSGDLAAFETLDFSALQSVNEPQSPLPLNQPAVKAPPGPSSTTASPAASPITSGPTSEAVTVAPLLRRLQQAQAADAANAAVASNTASSAAPPDTETSTLDAASWPSPIVYPLRPVKKRHSLAMVDLPSFPKS